MENRDNVKEKEDKDVFVLELISEIKEQSRRWFRAFLIMVVVEVLPILTMASTKMTRKRTKKNGKSKGTARRKKR